MERFFVMPDDGMDVLIEPLRSAKRTIDIYVFTLSNTDILGALRDAVARGVSVRALVDTHPSGNESAGKAALDALKHAGVDARTAPSYFAHLHAKSYVVDSSLAMISSVNFLQDWQRTRDHGVITDAPGVLQALVAAFDADWHEHKAETTNVPPPPLVLSPNNSRATIMSQIESAAKSLIMEEEQVTDESIVSALAARSNAGVKVELLTNSAQEKNAQALADLLRRAPGARVAYSSKLWLHSKLVIVDGVRMLIGSVNLTGESLDNRREVSIMISNPAAVARAIEVTKADFASASSTPLDAHSRPASPADSPSDQEHKGTKHQS